MIQRNVKQNIHTRAGNRITWKHLQNKKLQDLEYTYATGLISNTVKYMKNIIKCLGRRVSANMSMHKSQKRTRCGLDTIEKLYIKQQEMQKVDEFYYLDSILNKNGGTEASNTD